MSITVESSIKRAMDLLNSGHTFAEIKSLIEVKAKNLTEGEEKQALRKAYAHILGIERAPSRDSNADHSRLITNLPKQAANDEAPAFRNDGEPVAPKVAITADGRNAQIPDGTYTVVMQGGERRTIRIKKHWDDAEAQKGTRVIAFLTGSDNERDYTGCAFLTRDSRVIMWKRFRNGSAVLQAAIAYLIQGGNHEEAGMLYAVESGNCWHCHRTLTVPASVSRGLGPICAAKLGYA